ncbi:MAG: YchJ family metal-binding protein [Desulfobulbus sp.]|nr:YchJ family metal-binding protein [Desulfobulbus sp.]
MAIQTLCPCESGLPFAACCGPLLAGEQSAATAEALMRSRYTAYTRVAISYLLETWHSSSRPETIDVDSIPHWCGLEILSCEKGQAEDSEGVVEFRATAIANDRLIVLRERSRFVREERVWRYLDGEFIEEEHPTMPKPPPAENKKVGRNDPCPCGSGKKFKKCCGP